MIFLQYLSADYCRSQTSTQMWGCLWSNFLEVEHHLHKVKPGVMFLLETGLNLFILFQDFATSGYSLLIVQYNSQKYHSHGLSAYIKDGLPYGKDPQNSELDFPFMCFCMALINSMAFIFIVYRLQGDGIVMFDKIQGCPKVLSATPKK